MNSHPVDERVRPIEECTVDDLVNRHAFVYGRCKIWVHSLTDQSKMEFTWSKYAWWKAMWYPHHGPPRQQGTWGIYAGHQGFTGPNDAQVTHFMRMPDPPITLLE